MHWLMRAKRWVQDPPSMGWVKFVLAIVLLVIVMGLIEHFFGWPEALTPNWNGRRGPRL